MIKMVPLPFQQQQGDARGGDDMDGWNDPAAVEVGATNDADAANKAAGGGEPPVKEPKPLSGAAKAAKEAKEAREAAAAEPGDEGQGDPAPELDDEGKPVNPAKPRINQLTKKVRVTERENENLKARIAELEKTSGQAVAAGASADAIGPAPDPTDAAKYPLGHLDDRYVDDKLEWLAETKAAKKADEALLKTQQDNQRQAADARQQIIQNQIDDLASAGADISDDYDEKVVKTAMKGEWMLTQQTFEAAHEVEHGAQILYDLSQDKAEALRVSQLSIRQQVKYVDEKNDAIAAKKKGRSKPQDQQGVPSQTRGVGSKTKIDPATDDMGEFEKLWVQGGS